ncbi:MAG: group I intron-associated PD-(D/E)XK endonuclease [Terriglobales bacterium]
MKISGASIERCKERGEWAEMRFMARASEHGLYVSKPWGESRRYDFILEHDGKFLRVQVKSTTCRRGRSYICHVRSGRSYTSKEVDFVAAYVIPTNTWFIFPIEVVLKGAGRLVLSPHRRVSKYGPYEEAWHLLRGKEVFEAAGNPPSLIAEKNPRPSEA